MKYFPWRNVLNWLDRIFPWVLAGAVAGLLVRDHWGITKTLYFLPPAVIGPLGVAWSVREAARGRTGRSLWAGVGSVILLAKLLLVDFSWTASTAGVEPTFRLVHWNVMRAPFGEGGFLETLRSDDPDIVVISEPPDGFDLEAARQKLFPDRFAEQAHMPLLSRFPIEEAVGIRIRKGAAWCIQLSTPQGPVRLVGLDIESSPFGDRSVPLAGLQEWMDAHWEGPPFLIVGDFNIPADSVHLAPIRRRFDHAYRQGGKGWPYSWPVPFPVYSIDHAWVDSRLRVSRYELRSSVYSDHRRQYMDIAFRDSVGIESGK